jgi:hypothetical protein
VRRQYEAALATFAAKRVAPGATVDGHDFTLFLFQKRFASGTQLVQFANGEFIAAVGTLFYKGKMGEPALRELHADYGEADLYAGLAGQFGVVLRKRGRLAWFNDYFGVYHLYETRGVVTSSLLAAAATLPKLELSRQALYEYLFDAAVYGGETLFAGVRRLGVGRGPRHAPVAESFDEQVDAATAELVAYFRMLRTGFGDEPLLGFSGGYDSRLLLAAALKAGLRPRLFVGGAAGTTDVRIACAIADGERLALEHLDTASLDSPPPERFPAIVEEKLAYYDGLGIRGAINDGEEYHWRVRRMARASVELNGGGGEIYRDFWKLPDRPIQARDFVRRVMEFKNLDKVAALRGFNRDEYRERLVEKLGQETLTREDVARLYPVLRSSAFAGPTCKEMNLLGHSLLPFAEPAMAFPSCRVPLEHKVCGRFEAEMIRRLSPRLASYPSTYGFRFSDGAPLVKRARESADRHCRSVLPLPLVFAAYRLLRKKSQYNSAPYYYSDQYLRTVLDFDRLAMADYVDPQAMRTIAEPHFLSRVLTVELLLTTPPWQNASALPRAA